MMMGKIKLKIYENKTLEFFVGGNWQGQKRKT